MLRSHKELDVWNNAMDAAVEIFQLSRTFPIEERYSLTDQIRRSSRSVAAQLSEAWRKRRYVASFKNKLNDAEGEAAETQTWIEFARRCGYWDLRTATTLDERYEVIIKQIVRMHENADRWCVSIDHRAKRS